MNPSCIFLRILLLLAGWLLTSCIDSHEEVWVEADGSGRAELRVSVPAAAAVFHGGENGVREMVREFLDSAPQLKNSSSSLSVHDGRMEVKVAASFDSPADLVKIPSGDSVRNLPGPAEGLAGSVEFHVEGRSFEVARTIHAGKALPGSMFMPASQTKGRSLVYIIHLPSPPRASNATRTENDGRTLVWDFPLATALKGPFTIGFEGKVPLPRWLLALAGGSVVVLAGLAAVGTKRLRSRSRRRDITAT